MAFVPCVTACGRTLASNKVPSCWKSSWRDLFCCPDVLLQGKKHVGKCLYIDTDLKNSLTGSPQSSVRGSLGSAAEFWRWEEGVGRGHSRDDLWYCWGFGLLWCSFTSLLWAGVNLRVYLRLDVQRILQSCCDLICRRKEVPKWAQGKSHLVITVLK